MKYQSRYKRITLALIFLLLPLSLAFGQNTSQKHMLWKVTSPNGEVNYLAGSVHIMKPSVYPLDDVFQKVFKKSEQLVFELNFDSLKANRMQLMQKYAMLPQGTTLKDKISADVYQHLKTKLDSLGMPIARFKQFKPFMVSMIIMNLKLMQAGYAGTAGIDMHFFKKAKQANKQVIGLETPVFQMKLLSNLSGEFTDSFVEHNLKKAGQMVENVQEIISAWKQGDTATLDSLIQKEMRKNSPELYKKLVLQRNRKWIPTIEKLFNNGQTTWVITGAGHMIGNKGVVAMLRDAGYKVKQL